VHATAAIRRSLGVLVVVAAARAGDIALSVVVLAREGYIRGPQGRVRPVFENKVWRDVCLWDVLIRSVTWK